MTVRKKNSRPLIHLHSLDLTHLNMFKGAGPQTWPPSPWACVGPPIPAWAAEASYSGEHAQ